MLSHKNIRDFIKKHRVTEGSKFSLADHDSDDTGKLDSGDKDAAADLLKDSLALMVAEQDKLYAQDCWALLLIFQAPDAAGKDSVIRHVMSGVNPQSCEVHSFKAPSPDELDHDYLWRCAQRVPQRGRIGIFNRSYYEEVLIVRVRKQILAGQKIPPSLVDKTIWKSRFADIRNYEEYLSRNGVVIRKFFLNVSKAEQKERFLERIDEPEKNWKFSMFDVRERERWDDYQHAYEQMVQHTATEAAPWFVVPADRKWYTRLVVSAAIVDALLDLDLHYPTLDASKKADLKAAKAALLAE